MLPLIHTLASTSLIVAMGSLLQVDAPRKALPAKPVAAAAPTVSVKGYKQWTRVNPKPHRVTAMLATACFNPIPEQAAAWAIAPHRDKFVTVYVNAVAKQAMLRQAHPKFPRGSLIVKEKLTTADSKTPELLTVMHKREKDFSPKNGDWQYLVMDGDANLVKPQGDVKACRSCHAQWRGTDFVTRAYLTNAMMTKLR